MGDREEVASVYLSNIYESVSAFTSYDIFKMGHLLKS